MMYFFENYKMCSMCWAVAVVTDAVTDQPEEPIYELHAIWAKMRSHLLRKNVMLTVAHFVMNKINFDCPFFSFKQVQHA